MGEGRPKADHEQTIWRPADRNAFPYRRHLVRSEAYDSVGPLHEPRNWGEPYQPIYHLDLVLKHQRILDVRGWMCPEMHKWINDTTQVRHLLRERADVATPG